MHEDNRHVDAEKGKGERVFNPTLLCLGSPQAAACPQFHTTFFCSMYHDIIVVSRSKRAGDPQTASMVESIILAG